MKKWFTLSLVLFTAAVSQAVNIAWTVPQSQYSDAIVDKETGTRHPNWTNVQSVTDSDGNKYSTVGFSVYFVYSSTQLGLTNDKLDKGLAAEQAYALATDGTVTGYTGQSTVVQGHIIDPTEKTSSGQLCALGTNLPPEPTTTGSNPDVVNGSGYYYMVIVNNTPENSNNPEYAVAGTGTKTTISTTIGSNGYTYASTTDGVYVDVVGQEPNTSDYFDLGGWLGGNWTNAITPEPTVLALLALGVAGVALRRKKNFTK